MRVLGRIVLWMGICLVLLFIPVIPLQSAPVVENPVYRPVLHSLFQVVSGLANPPVGVYYRWEWCTLPVVVVLLAIAVASGVLLLRKRSR